MNINVMRQNQNFLKSFGSYKTIIIHDEYIKATSSSYLIVQKIKLLINGTS